MYEVINKCWEHYQKNKDSNYVVKGIPILYFGDRVAYEKSQIKIITASLNPSSSEFSNNDSGAPPYSFFRFPLGESIWNLKTLDEEGQSIYKKTLNDYFKIAPYDWFDNLEPLLNGLKASYYDNSDYKYRVLHTDICTPLATNPKWTDLRSNEREGLMSDGKSIWELLIESLDPDIILISVGQTYLRNLNVNKILSRDVFKSYLYKVDGISLYHIPYTIELYKYKLDSGKIVYIFYGNQRVKPFCDVGRRKLELGKEIYEYWLSNNVNRMGDL